MTALALSALRKAYPGFTLGPVDLDVGAEVLCVLGPSGCGKSTLLSLVAGVATPDAGTVALDGRPLSGLPPEDRGTVLLFQDGALFPHLTARENVAYAAGDAARVDELIATLELGPVLDQRADTLSGGQAQRVALARALAADPAALLLDEPLSDLDAPIRRRMRDEMGDLLATAGVPVVYVTHDQREAAALGDRVAVMRDGAVHQVGTPREVFERPATPFVAAFTGASNVLRARARDDGALDWGPHVLATDAAGLAPGTAVWTCVRPERIEVVDGASPTGAGTALPGRLVRRTYEGDVELLSVAIEGVADPIDVAAPPPAAGDLADGDAVTVWLPAGTVHVIGPVEDGDAVPAVGPGPPADR